MLGFASVMFFVVGRSHQACRAKPDGTGSGALERKQGPCREWWKAVAVMVAVRRGRNVGGV
ncbi:MAG TPA: hypothetical protein VK157_06495 [Phycisphaerales bacterium]|nr:hypothetical protein [Phycisphaerales bacterium]